MDHFAGFGGWHIAPRESNNSPARQYRRKLRKVWKLTPLERKLFASASGILPHTRKALRRKKGRK